MIGDGLREQITPLLGKAAAAEATADSAVDLRTSAIGEIARLDKTITIVDQVPDTTITAKREALSLGFKVGFFVGDSTILALLFNRAGSPLVLSLLAGVSLASSMVAVGSTAGHRRAAFDQRDGRGDAPANCDLSVRHLFREQAPADLAADEEFVPSRPDVPWVAASAMVAAATFVGLLMLGLNAGDGTKFAVGAALLAAVTVVGSAAAEAFGTNEGADLRKRLTKQKAAPCALIEEHAELNATAAEARARSQSLMVALIHTAHGAARSTRWLAGREPDNPRVFDVDHPASVTERSLVPGLGVNQLLALVGLPPGHDSGVAADAQDAATPTPTPLLGVADTEDETEEDAA